MRTSKRSKRSSGRSKPKHSRLGRRLIAAAREVLGHVRGEIELPSYVAKVPEGVDVATLRKRLGLSQRRFADAFGLDVAAIHSWEHGRRKPDRAARVLLQVIAREPDAVRRALAA